MYSLTSVEYLQVSPTVVWQPSFSLPHVSLISSIEIGLPAKSFVGWSVNRLIDIWQPSRVIDPPLIGSLLSAERWTSGRSVSESQCFRDKCLGSFKGQGDDRVAQSLSTSYLPLLHITLQCLCFFFRFEKQYSRPLESILIMCHLIYAWGF